MLDFKIRILTAAAMLFVVSGCGVQSSAPYSQGGVMTSSHDPEYSGRIRDADANSNDPLKQHMLARNAVDPVHVSKKNRHVKSVAENHAKEGEHFRTLSLEPKMDDGSAVIPPAKPSINARSSNTPKPNTKPSYRGASGDGGARAFKLTPKTEIRNSPSVNAKGSVGIRDVRLGEHKGKTRVVLDVSRALSYQTWLQDDNHVLVVSLPDGFIDGARSKILKGHPLIKAYGFNANANGVGMQFIVTFHRPARIGMKNLLKPNSIYNNHRLVIDVLPR